MLEPEEVDEGYFTPIASTTLASIFRDNLKNDESVNSSLKYKPPQPKKIEQCTKLDDPNPTQLVYSCPVTAYEWEAWFSPNGTHKYKKKVGFAIIRTINTGLCKIILYTPDKSTLSCTTVSAQLEVTLKGTLISLYDDHRKYWGLHFNEKTIDEVTQLLQKENVVINNYESTHINNETLKPEVDSVDSEDTSDETDRSSVAKKYISTSNNERASILSRIANVGHAILLSTPVSPVKKLNQLNRLNTKEPFSSCERLNVLTDISESRNPHTMTDNDFTRSIAVQASASNTEHDNILSSNIKHIGSHHIASVPLVNNQVFTYVNGCMVPVHMPIPDDMECGISSAEIEDIVQKLTRLQGHLKTNENLKINGNSQITEKENTCSCQNQTNDASKHLDGVSTRSILCVQNEENLKKILDLEELIREKNEVIIKLQNEVKNEEQKNIDVLQKHNYSSTMLKKEIEHLKQALIKNENEFSNMISQSEASSLIAHTVKKLMNDTFHSFSRNFENEDSYSGNNIKGILAAVIKKCTVQSLSALPNSRETCNLPAEPTN